jgi:hypothetical protein
MHSIMIAYLAVFFLGGYSAQMLTIPYANQAVAGAESTMLTEKGAEFELRVYTIKKGEMANWIGEWRRYIYPLRVKFGFTVLGPWVIKSTNQFVWILGYGGREGFKSRDGAYYASAARKAITPNPARLIEQPQQWYMSAIQP